MPSLKTIVAAATLFAISANTQRVYTIDPDTVPIGLRQSWCVTQRSSCPLLCLQLPGKSSTTEANDCEPENLQYECICGNGLTPNASEFSQTLPFFLCQEFGNRCVNSCGGAPTCQAACREDNPCGAQDPTRVNVTSTTSSQTASATDAEGTPQGSDGVVYNGFGGAAKTTAAPEASTTAETTRSAANAMLNLGQSYGLAVVFTGVFAGFALVM